MIFRSKRAGRPQSPGRRRFLKAAAGAALVGAGTPTYAYAVEPAHPVVTRRDIRLKGWPQAAAGLKIGQISDLHCQDERAVARADHAVLLLLAEKPDAVFLTGDYITSGEASGDWMPAAAAALEPLRHTPRGVYAILGNHDYADGHQANVATALEGNGFTTLRNRSVPLPGTPGVWIVGLESLCAAAQNPAEALRGVPPGAVKILLVHEPDFADIAPPGFCLQLSGHSHAGQIRLPGLPPLYCPIFGRQYPEGLQQAAHHPVYTTRGVGMMGPQMRLCCPPEVTVLTLHPA